MRRPFSSSTEAYYEPKGMSVNYLTYKFTDKFTLSLFDGGIWSKGDSVTSKSVHGMFYNPVPFLNSILVSDQNEFYSLSGLNASYIISNRLRLYGQLVTNDFNTSAYQLGWRYYNFFGLNKAMFQLEYNDVPSGVYVSQNSRLSYSNGNLPLAHVKGNGFTEFVGRLNYEYQRFYLDVKFVLYTLKDHQNTVLNAYSSNQEIESGKIQHQLYEIGYRFNKKINLTLFGSYLFRKEDNSELPNTQFLSIGLRTGLVNHYNDF